MNCTRYAAPYLSRQPWAFLPQDLISQLQKAEEHCEPLSILADIFVGVQTSADNIYIIHADREDSHFVYSYEKDGTEIKLEKDILRKSVYDAKLTSYEKIEANSYIIFPYKEVDGKPRLYDIEEMEECFPNALEYLNRTVDVIHPFGAEQVHAVQQAAYPFFPLQCPSFHPHFFHLEDLSFRTCRFLKRITRVQAVRTPVVLAS